MTNTKDKAMTKKTWTHPDAWHPGGGLTDAVLYLDKMSKAALVDIVLDALALQEPGRVTLAATKAFCDPRLIARGDSPPNIKRDMQYQRMLRDRGIAE